MAEQFIDVLSYISPGSDYLSINEQFKLICFKIVKKNYEIIIAVYKYWIVFLYLYVCLNLSSHVCTTGIEDAAYHDDLCLMSHFQYPSLLYDDIVIA